MRKLLTFLALAVTLSIPYAAFANPVWYGSLRAGIESSGGNVAVKDGGSRWGIKGTASTNIPGLNAVYRFEHKISTEDASQPGGRLAYVGLSGGFGTVSAGQIWSASYNSFGAVTDNSRFYGSSQTTYRHGNVVSYAFSNSMMGVQLDAAYGGPKGNATNPNSSLQKVEFGMSVNIGTMGKVAFAHVNDKYTSLDKHLVATATDGTYDAYDVSTWESKTNSIAGEISVSNLTVYVGTQTAKDKNTTGAAPSGYTPLAQDDFPEGERPEDYQTFGTPNHGSAIADKEQKTTFFGVRGGLGGTGIDYVFQLRDIKDDNRPWILGLGKDLGGGASLSFEHADNDGDGDNASRVSLQVDF